MKKGLSSIPIVIVLYCTYSTTVLLYRTVLLLGGAKKGHDAPSPLSRGVFLAPLGLYRALGRSLPLPGLLDDIRSRRPLLHIREVPTSTLVTSG